MRCRCCWTGTHRETRLTFSNNTRRFSKSRVQIFPKARFPSFTDARRRRTSCLGCYSRPGYRGEVMLLSGVLRAMRPLRPLQDLPITPHRPTARRPNFSPRGTSTPRRTLLSENNARWNCVATLWREILREELPTLIRRGWTLRNAMDLAQHNSR